MTQKSCVLKFWSGRLSWRKICSRYPDVGILERNCFRPSSTKATIRPIRELEKLMPARQRLVVRFSNWALILRIGLLRKLAVDMNFEHSFCRLARNVATGHGPQQSKHSFVLLRHERTPNIPSTELKPRPRQVSNPGHQRES